jgi:hypothetical protein
VTDPRGALLAIEAVLDQPKPTDSRVVSIKVFDNPGSSKPLQAKIVVEFSKNRIEPRHLIATIASLQDLGNQLFGAEGECDDPDCPVHGKGAATTDLGELFKQFEAEAKSKGKLQ